MEPDFETIIFYAFAALAVLPAVLILFTRDIVRVAFCLLGSLGAVAGLYVLLSADFLAATQVLVYIGGVMVLILFGIMMTNKDPVMLRTGRKPQPILGGVVVAALTAVPLLAVMVGTGWERDRGIPPEPTTRGLGHALLTDYVLPFEVISVLLLVVLCGAAYIARRGREQEEGDA